MWGSFHGSWQDPSIQEDSRRSSQTSEKEGAEEGSKGLLRGHGVSVRLGRPGKDKAAMETFLEGLGRTLKCLEGRERRGRRECLHRAVKVQRPGTTTWGRFRKPGQKMAGGAQLDGEQRMVAGSFQKF